MQHDIMSLSMILNFSVFDYIKKKPKRLFQEVSVDVRFSMENCTNQSLGK
jgi:hypothetical protein